MSEEKKALKPEVVELAKIMKEIIVINGDKAELPEDFYKKNLPEGVTAEQATKLSKHNVNVMAAAALAIGEKAIPVMAKNPDLKQVTLSFPTVSRDRMEASISRERTVTIRNPSTGVVVGEEARYGTPTVRHAAYGSSTSRGQLAIVKQMLQEQATKAFGK